MPPKPTKSKNVGLKKGPKVLPPDVVVVPGLSRDTESIFDPVPQSTAKETGKRQRTQDSSSSGSDHSDEETTFVSPPDLLPQLKIKK